MNFLDISYMREAAAWWKRNRSKLVCGAELGMCAGYPPVTCTRARHTDGSRHYSHIDKVFWW